MRSLALFLLTVCSAVFLRVEPAAVMHCDTCVHCPCQAPSDCGMPCGGAQGQSSTALTTVERAQVSKAARIQKDAAVQVAAKKFYAPYAVKATATAALHAPDAMATTAGVPLFMAHCRFLI